MLVTVISKKYTFNYDAELQINKATMVQFLDGCVPDICSGFLANIFMCQIKHKKQHKLKRDTIRPKRQANAPFKLNPYPPPHLGICGALVGLYRHIGSFLESPVCGEFAHFDAFVLRNAGH